MIYKVEGYDGRPRKTAMYQGSWIDGKRHGKGTLKGQRSFKNVKIFFLSQKLQSVWFASVELHWKFQERLDAWRGNHDLYYLREKRRLGRGLERFS